MGCQQTASCVAAAGSLGMNGTEAPWGQMGTEARTSSGFPHCLVAREGAAGTAWRHITPWERHCDCISQHILRPQNTLEKCQPCLSLKDQWDLLCLSQRRQPGAGCWEAEQSSFHWHAHRALTSLQAQQECQVSSDPRLALAQEYPLQHFCSTTPYSIHVSSCSHLPPCPALLCSQPSAPLATLSLPSALCLTVLGDDINRLS